MSLEKEMINGKQFKDMLLGAYRSFEKNFRYINDLNVFPVPDGDTGSNMMHTMASVAKAVSVMDDGADVGEVGSTAARSAIMGARGNSGVILSQLLRGIGRGVVGKKRVSNGELSKAFQYGILYAYRSVAKPVEGTILSVARGMAKGAYDIMKRGTNLEEILEELIRIGKQELAETPDKLPALKAAGVVDAGGQGLIAFFEGCLAGLRGQDCAVLEVPQKAAAHVHQQQTLEPLDLEYPYCTEVIIKEAQVDKKTVTEALGGLGNSMIVAVVEDIVKIHIHSKNPGNILNIAQQWGSLHDIKIENMKDQHENRIFSDEEVAAAEAAAKQGIGIIAVAAGEGIADIMKQMGVTDIISGGQSMNPSVEAFVNAVENGRHEKYIILPNNKNIILAAEQVKKLLGEEKVAFVPTTNLAQGLAALLSFDKERGLEENTLLMAKAAREVDGGAITLAVRDSVVDGVTIHEGDYLGLLNDKIVCTGNDLRSVLHKMLADKDYELLSLYYGSDMQPETAEAIAAELEELNEDWEVELFPGGQPLYPLLMAFE